MTNELPEAISRFIDAVNNFDTAAFLNSFASGGTVNDWGRTFTGVTAIKGWSDRELIGARGHLTVTRVEEAEGETLVTGDWRSTHANGLSLFAFTVDDGNKIELLRITEG